MTHIPKGKKMYTESDIQAIADAIRKIDGDETKMLVTDMPTRIEKLSRSADTGTLETALNEEIRRSKGTDMLHSDKIGVLEGKMADVKLSIESLRDVNVETDGRIDSLADRVTNLEENGVGGSGGADTEVTNRLLDKLDRLEEYMQEVEDIFEAEY